MESLDVHLDARYLPGQSNVLADLLSCRDQVIRPEWPLHPQVARAVLRVWGSPSLDLFATRLNAKLLSCSLLRDPQVVFEDTFRYPWNTLDVYAFPPFLLVRRVVARVREIPNLPMTLWRSRKTRCPSGSGRHDISGVPVLGEALTRAARESQGDPGHCSVSSV